MRDKEFSLFFVFIVFIIPVFFQGCSKDELTTVNGTIVNSGSYSSGGCEWIITVGAQKFKADNLPSQFKQDGLNVEITYRVVRLSVDCPLAGTFAGTIHLNRIKQI